MGGRPVFVLEDEVPVRTVLVDALTSVGHDVRDFGDGQQALDEIERVVPDLILLDMRMPRMDGFTFLSALRRKPTRSNMSFQSTVRSMKSAHKFRMSTSMTT